MWMVQSLLCMPTAMAADLASLPVPERADKTGDEPWLKQAREHVFTPTTERVKPVCVTRTEGMVEGAEALLGEKGRNCRLTYDTGGVKPVVILDFGKQGAGGFAEFTVTAKTGLPVLRLAYACHPDGIGETGCFDRGSRATYLGGAVDLPVLPTNVNRHETYTIPRIGRFIAPLVQGHTRYVRVQLDTPGTSVDIDSVSMVNKEVYDHSPHDGYFLCSDERLNRLWYVSTWTLQIASLPNQNAWKTLDGWLLPRNLEQADEIGLSSTGEKWQDVTLETVFELRANPNFVAAAGVAFRAKHARNAYTAEVSLDGVFKLRKRIDGKDTVISEKKLMEPLIDGRQYKLEVSALGPVLTTRLDGTVIDESRDETFVNGRVGFYTPKEKWPLFDYIIVKDGKGQNLLTDDFSGNLSQWQFARTLSSIVDGGKRDRLLWTGDLYFGQRNVYYASGNPTYMRDSIKMMAFNQTPEGYVHASPYAERSVPPPSGDYGPFPSDEFAAWLAPVAWDHLLYTDDVETLKKNDHGKFQSLASRGRFEYGFGQSAMQAIFDHHWLQLLDTNWKGTATTSECMNMLTRGWGDESHPDTAIAAHFSAYILGATPTVPGLSRFQVRPTPVKEVTWARGVVPTPHGPITAAWENAGKTFRLDLSVPQGAQADVVLPKGGTVLLNGRPGDIIGLKTGTYAIEVRDLPPDAWADPSEKRK